MVGGTFSGSDFTACQKVTCTFVPAAIHTLQRVYREWNERVREFLQELVRVGLGRGVSSQAASSMASAAVSAFTCGSMPTLLISCVTVPSTSASTQAAR
jgi:hypothetical protein